MVTVHHLLQSRELALLLGPQALAAVRVLLLKEEVVQLALVLGVHGLEELAEASLHGQPLNEMRSLRSW